VCNQENNVTTTPCKFSQLSCLAFLLRTAAETHELELSLSPGFVRRFMSSGRRSRVFCSFVFSLIDFGVGFDVISA